MTTHRLTRNNNNNDKLWKMRETNIEIIKQPKE